MALAAGMAAYDSGDYAAAIRILAESRELAAGPLDLRVRAHKISAFSYCVTSRRGPCRQQFVEALKLDPAFGLEPAERTHPIWSSEYEAARRSIGAPPAVKPEAPANRPPPRKPATPG